MFNKYLKVFFMVKKHKTQKTQGFLCLFFFFFLSGFLGVFFVANPGGEGGRNTLVSFFLPQIIINN